MDRRNLANCRMAVIALVIVAALSTASCATKKYVRNQVTPIDQRVTQVNQAANQNKESIAKLGEKEETDISRVSELAMTADNAAKDAAGAAKQADQKASDAQTMAHNVGDRVTQVDQSLRNSLEKIDNFQLVSTETVLFRFNNSTLTTDAMEKLDAAVQSVVNLQHYVIEVQGFTDTTGSRSHNLALSQRRADAVVRYLIAKHHIPLYRVHVAGMGEEAPAGNNQTRAGRQENRRVEVKLFSANWSGNETQTAQK
jgi:OOP family OmpA-OmpF porin